MLDVQFWSQQNVPNRRPYGACIPFRTGWDILDKAHARHSSLARECRETSTPVEAEFPLTLCCHDS
eukprot:6055018-Amphidinium_carterae.1